MKNTRCLSLTVALLLGLAPLAAGETIQQLTGSTINLSHPGGGSNGSGGEDELAPGRDPRKEDDIDEKGGREDACQCCKECKAATHSVLGSEAEAPPTDGCKDCCDRCGASDLPVPQKMPPEFSRE